MICTRVRLLTSRQDYSAVRNTSDACFESLYLVFRIECPGVFFAPGPVSMVCRSVWSSKFQIAFTRLKRVPFRVMHHRVASSADQIGHK